MSGYSDTVRLPFVCAAGSKDLYAVIVARAAYTPTNGGLFSVAVAVDQN